MKKIIPFFKINYNKDELNQLKDIANSGNLTMGSSTKKFEKEISKKLGLSEKNVALVSNCTSALHLSLIASNIKPDDEVLCSSLTFVADANSILYLGAKPIFVDIESEHNLNMCVSDLKKKINSKTKAVIMTHYAGYPCKINEIKSLCRKHKLILIEDACHTIFSKFKNKYLGTFGDFGVFSLYGNKNITTGEGGIILSKKNKIDFIKKLRNHGIEKKFKNGNPLYDIKNLGFNYRIDDLRSALGSAQIKKINKINLIRKKVAKNYCTLIEKKIANFKIPFRKFIGNNFSYHLFVILLPKKILRKNLIKHLYKKGIETSVHYTPIHKFKLYSKQKFRLKKLDKISEQLLSLPIYPKLKYNEQKLIIDKIYEFQKN